MLCIITSIVPKTSPEDNHWFCRTIDDMNTKVLGIDYGKRYIGLALSDEGKQLAFPEKIILNNKDVISYIKDIITRESIDTIVMGESYDLDGTPNSLMEDIRSFKTELEVATHMPVHFQKEFLSSFEASRFQHGRTRADDSAAAIILQRYLDLKNRSPRV